MNFLIVAFFAFSGCFAISEACANSPPFKKVDDNANLIRYKICLSGTTFVCRVSTADCSKSPNQPYTANTYESWALCEAAYPKNTSYICGDPSKNYCSCIDQEDNVACDKKSLSSGEITSTTHNAGSAGACAALCPLAAGTKKLKCVVDKTNINICLCIKSDGPESFCDASKSEIFSTEAQCQNACHDEINDDGSGSGLPPP